MATTVRETYKEWVVRQNREREAHRAALEGRYGTRGRPKAARLHELAWDYGHSAGLDEVENYYRDLAELIR